MENTHSVTNGSRASKILIDRDRLWKNTIYVNPRILKTSGDLIHHKMDIANVSPGYAADCIHSDTRKFDKSCNNQSVQQKVTGASEPFPAASKRVYLNPHFQRTASTSVHINPKKFSRVVEHSNCSLVNTQPDRTKQENKIIEVPKSNMSTSEERSPVPDTQNIKHDIHTSTDSIDDRNHCNIATPNKKWNRLNVDMIMSSKQVENTPITKKVSYNKLVRVSDTKLVRLPDKTKSWCVNRALQKASVTKQYPALTKYPDAQDGRTIKKKSEKQKKSSYAQMHFPTYPPPAVNNRQEKYKLSRKVLPTIVGKGKSDLRASQSCTASKYKIDRRLIKSRLSRNYKKVSLKYENGRNKFQRKNTPSKGHVLPILYRCRNSSIKNLRLGDGKKIIISSRKLLRIGSSTKTKEPTRKKGESSDTTRLIRIGGVLYKTSRTKLTRSRSQISSTKQPVVKRHKADKPRIIYIRGNKFIMDAKGKTLRQVSQKMNKCLKDGKTSPLKRVDIGGITFVQKSSDLLVRTDTHTARNIVNHAKNKSIAMLTNKLRKINQPCAFYRRFGKCPRKDKGMCQLVHDPKQIAVCKRFLQGECSIDNCPMSHQIVPEKMPTCKYFLEGCCIRENCPYLHVKLNSKAVICANFLQGYCAEGSKCKKRHSYVCPDFEKLGTCKKGKYCPYPHNKGSKLNKKTVPNQAKQVKADHSPGDLARKRYYQGEKTEAEDSSAPEEENFKSRILPHIDDSGGSATDKDEPVLKRPRIGRLPSFIALGQ